MKPGARWRAVLRRVGVEVVTFRRSRPDQWASVSPVTRSDGRTIGVSVTGPRRGLAVYRAARASAPSPAPVAVYLTPRPRPGRQEP